MSNKGSANHNYVKGEHQMVARWYDIQRGEEHIMIRFINETYDDVILESDQVIVVHLFDGEFPKQLLMKARDASDGQLLSFVMNKEYLA